MRNLIKNNKLAFLVALILFVVPFFWFRYGEVDYGGDSTRFYFYNPTAWLKNIALFYINPLISLGGEMANFSMIPFLSFLAGAKKILFNSSWWLNNFFNGILLGGGFLSVYLIGQELLGIGEEENKRTFPSIFSGLFFVFSPLLVFSWERALYSIHQVFVYPLVFLLFLKFIHTRRYSFLAWLPLVFLIFSVNFSFGTAPWLFAFFLFAFPFLFFYSTIVGKTTWFWRGLVIFIGLLFLTLAFDFLPQIYNMVRPSSVNYQLFFNEGGGMINRGLAYFMSIYSFVRLAYNFANQDQYFISQGFGSPFHQTIFDYGVKFLALYFLYPIVLCLGFVLQGKDSLARLKIRHLLLVFFVIILFFMTANISNFGTMVYKNLFYLPGFSMFRSFYSKFGMVYAFFYSLLLSQAMAKIFDLNFKRGWKMVLGFFLVGAVLINGWPLITGKISNGVLWRSENIAFTSKVDPVYETFIKKLKQEPLDYKVLGLPLTNESYQILKGEKGGVYFGPSTVTFLAGKHIFAGQGGFSVFWPRIEKLIEEKNYPQLNRIFSLLNIGYIFHNSDNYIYDNFPNYPYSDWFKQKFLTQHEVRDFINNLGYKKMYSYGPYSLYRNSSVTPRLFLAEKLIFLNSAEVNSFFEVLDFEKDIARLGVLSPSTGAKISREVLSLVDNYFVYGTSKDVAYMAEKNKIYEDGLAYLPVSQTPRWKWWKILLLESIDEWTERGNFLSFLRRKFVAANSRVLEVIDYKENEVGKFMVYCRKIKEILKIVKTADDNDLKVKIAYMLKFNLQDNLARLEKNPPKNFVDWQDKIRQFQVQTEEFLPQFSPQERNYLVDIPLAGKYGIFLDGVENDLVDGNKEAKISISINNQEIPFSLSESAVYDLNWQPWGETVQSEGKKLLKLKFNQLTNLLRNDTQVVVLPQAATLGSPAAVDGIDYPLGTRVSLKEIDNWSPDKWYLIKGIINSENKGKLILKENFALFEEESGQEITKSRVLKTIELAEGENQINFEIKSHPKSLSALLHLSENKKENSFLAGEPPSWENMTISKIVDPKVMLFLSKKGDDEKKSLPSITFSRISPVKYEIKAREITSVFGLIFSEAFNSGWKLYVKKCGGDDIFNKEEIQSAYFGGEVKESGHTNYFLNSSTFETWNKKPIAQASHFSVNGYANLWYIHPRDTGGEENCEFILEYWPQRVFYLGLLLSVIVVAVTVFYHLRHRLFKKN